MFRMGLLTTTAMTAVALLLSGAPTAAETNMHVASHDPNTRFLCTYGQFLVSVSSSSSSGPYVYKWTHIAAPVKGHGQIVRRIKVIEERKSNYSADDYFTAGIYSNTASGFPGRLIASGTHSSMADPGCGPVWISIPPTKLKRNTKYWIEETASNYDQVRPVSFYWIADPNTKRKAYVQSHYYLYSSTFGESSSYTSPWTKQTMGPYLKLK